MEEDLTAVVDEGRDESHLQPHTTNLHPMQPFLPAQRSHSLPNPSISNPSRHPYGQHWPRERARNADGSPLINVVPATPADSLHSLPMTGAPTGHGVDPSHHHHQFAQNNMLEPPRGRNATPPLPDPNDMDSSRSQDSSSSSHAAGKSKRVAFGPRLDCEKCRQGEMHFAHVQYE